MRELAAGMRSDFNLLLIRDGTVAGYGRVVSPISGVAALRVSRCSAP